MKGEQQKLFEDVFTVTDIDPNNKTPFRNVSRIHMASQYKVQMEIDIHSQLYPLTKGTRLFVKTTKGQHTRNVYNKEQIAKINQKDNFDYVMYGVVFQIQKSKDGDIIIYASFGGLIMKLKGNQAVLAGFRKEQTQARIYIMIRKA